MNTLRPTSALTLALAAALPSAALAQPTVDWFDPSWQDLGTTDVVSLSGNFLPGWTSVNASPDLGDDLFFNTNESYTGVDNDAAIWLNTLDPTRFNYATSNEVVELSLSGFAIGQQYQLDFAASLLWHGTWNASVGQLEVALTGADISTWTSTTLTDAVEFDGMNEWIDQSIAFTATSSVVTFRFGEGSVTGDENTVERIGIDGFRSRLVPAPSGAAALALAGVLASRRRR